MTVSALKQLLELCPHLTLVKAAGDDLIEVQFMPSMAPAPQAKPSHVQAEGMRTDVDAYGFRLPAHARPQAE